MSKSLLLSLSCVIASLYGSVAVAQTAATPPAATPAVTPGQGTPPALARPGWINQYNSVAGAEKFNRRAQAINNGLENWFEVAVVDGKAAGAGRLLEMLDTTCRGTTGDAIAGGQGDLYDPLNGICGQWKSDVNYFFNRGRIHNFAFCANYRGALRSFDRIRRDPNLWWYVGTEAERLQRNMTRLGNTEIGWAREFVNSQGEVVGRENKTIVGILTGRPKPTVSCPV